MTYIEIIENNQSIQIDIVIDARVEVQRNDYSVIFGFVDSISKTCSVALHNVRERIQW